MDDDRLSIQQVAEATDLSVHTLRYYEQAELMIDVPRRRNGHRTYGQRHLRWITFLKRLRSAGMSIAQVRRYAELTRAGDATLAARAELLEHHRDQVEAKLRELGEHLAMLERKIALYRERGVGCEGGDDEPPD